MKIAVVGAGGVGGYFGALFATRGHEVHLIARGEHLQTIRKNGLFVSSPNGDFHTSSINATDTPSEAGIADAVIVAVKGWQLEEVVPLITKLCGPDTLILPLLNGVEATDTLHRQLENGIVLNGLCGIIAKIDSPGKITHVAIDPFVKFGTKDKSIELDQLKKAFSDCGVDAQIPNDITRAIWMKFLFIAPLSGVTSLTRATIDIVRTLPGTREMLGGAITEAMFVGRSLGVNLGNDDADATLTMIDNTPIGGTTSMQRDVQAASPSELDTQTGAIVRLGEECNIDTPVNNFIYRALLPQEHAARGMQIC